jgi:hypothetical protein
MKWTINQETENNIFISDIAIVYTKQEVCIKMQLKIHEQVVFCPNRIGGVMISVLASSVVDRGFEGQTKDYKSGICCFSAKHTVLKW